MLDSFLDSDARLAGAGGDASAARGAWRQRIGQLGIDRVQVRIVLVAVAASVACCVVLVYGVEATHRAEQAHVRQQDEDLAHALKLHVTAAFELVDDVLKASRAQWLAEGRIRDQWTLGQDVPNFRTLITQVAVIDAQGQLLAASSIDPAAESGRLQVADRQYYSTHLGSIGDRLFIGQPVVGRMSGRPGIPLSRPVFARTGEFAGVVVAVVDPSAIQQFFADYRAAPGRPSFGLIGADGVARLWVGTHQIPLERHRAETLSSRNRLHGLVEVAAADQPSGATSWYVEPLDQFPLSVAVSADRTGLQAQARARKAGAWALAVLFLACIGGMSFHLVRARRQRNAVVRELRERQQRTLAASDIRERVLADVSHELRTPINAILGFSELVSMSGDPVQTASLGRLIHQNAEHLHGLIHTILDLVRINAGSMEVFRADVALRELCESAVAPHRQAAQHKGLTLDLVYAADLPTLIHTDRTKLSQVLHKLLGHAVRLTAHGRMRLHVDQLDERLRMRVDGADLGMIGDQLQGLFDRSHDPARRLEPLALERAIALDLQLCQGLLTLLGGHIVVQSPPEQGTAVEIWLPADALRR